MGGRGGIGGTEVEEQKEQVEEEVTWMRTVDGRDAEYEIGRVAPVTSTRDTEGRERDWETEKEAGRQARRRRRG